MKTTERPLLRTRCACCQHPFTLFASISMLLGNNSGHVSCPKCDAFLHVEALEGNEAWTEPWQAYLDRTTHGPSLIEQHTRAAD